ncbi:hypothetical protein MKW92_041466 [Papaver armeniacum]|nr:hypothetical protein MKW92_041466 [Papaver armeniacum]
MSIWRKPKVAIDTIRYLSSKILTRSGYPVREGKHHNNNISRVSCNSKLNSFHAFEKQNHPARPHFNGARTFYRGAYHAYKNQIPRDLRSILNQILRVPRKTLITAGLVAGGVFITVWGSERIPYSKRIHLIFLSKDFERTIGEHSFNGVVKQYEGRILPETHPESVRVKLVVKDIIEALQRGLRYEPVERSDLAYNNEVHDDDKGVRKKCTKKGQAKGSKVATHHLEGLNWEILVVDYPVVNAFCVPSGKIVVLTGLLDRFKSDAEVATIIAHEVGHVVARHGAENISNTMCFAILMIVLSLFADTSKITNLDDAYKYFLHLPFSRKYLFQCAPQVYEKLGDGNSSSSDYLSTHPSGKKRAQLLSRDKVMEEAFSIYRESNSGRGIEGFL